MKHNLLLATLLGICSASQLMCMEEKQQSNGRLNFVIEQDNLTIKASSAQGMKYYLDPKQFLGKNITEVLPLNETDYQNMTKGFQTAANENKTVYVLYALDENPYIAKITAVTGEEYLPNDKVFFFVKVKEKPMEDQ